MGLPELIRTVAELLLSGEGMLFLGMAAVSLIAAPVVQRQVASATPAATSSCVTSANR